MARFAPPGLMGPAVTRDCEDSRDPERSRSERLGMALKRVVYVKGLMRSFFECSMIFGRARLPGQGGQPPLRL